MLMSSSSTFKPSFLQMNSGPVCPVSIPVSESTHFRVISHEMSSDQCGPCSEISALRLLMPEETEETAATEGMESEPTRMEPHTVMAEMQVTAGGGAAACIMSDMEEPMLRQLSKTDSPSKRKGKHCFEKAVYKMCFPIRADTHLICDVKATRNDTLY